MSDWQLDGLPGDVRQEAENAAQREGLPLHRWLGKLIRESCDEEGVSTSRELMHGGASGNGNGQRSQSVVAPRPQGEPIRTAPQAPQRPTAAPMVARQTDPSRQPNRVPPARRQCRRRHRARRRRRRSYPRYPQRHPHLPQERRAACRRRRRHRLRPRAASPSPSRHVPRREPNPHRRPPRLLPPLRTGAATIG